MNECMVLVLVITQQKNDLSVDGEMGEERRGGERERREEEGRGRGEKRRGEGHH